MVELTGHDPFYSIQCLPSSTQSFFRSIALLCLVIAMQSKSCKERFLDLHPFYSIQCLPSSPQSFFRSIALLCLVIAMQSKSCKERFLHLHMLATFFVMNQCMHPDCLCKLAKVKHMPNQSHHLCPI